jgi:hypothetical protein
MEADVSFLTFGATVDQPETAYLGDLFPGGDAPEGDVTMWSQLSGPSLVEFSNPTDPLSYATFAEPGRYVLRFDTSDGPVVFGDSISIEIVNQAPVIELPTSGTMDVTETINVPGAVTDDRIPNFTLETQWHVIATPDLGEGIPDAQVVFSDDTNINTEISVSDPGDYVLRFSANDGMVTTQEFLTLHVEGEVVEEPEEVTVEIFVEQDAHVTESWGDGNFGNAPTVELDSDPDYVGLLEFDLSNLPADAAVLDAIISVDVTNPCTQSYYVYAANSDWSEDDVTWNSRPGHDGIVLGELPPSQGGVTDIILNDAGKAVVESWINNPLLNYGFILENFDNNDGGGFKSKEYEDAMDQAIFEMFYQI